jgi:hypothetical protein
VTIIEVIGLSARNLSISFLQADKQFQQHALARAAAAKHAEVLTHFDFRVNAAQDRLIAERFAQALDFDRRFAIGRAHHSPLSTEDRDEQLH